MSVWSSVQRDVHFEYYVPAESEIDDKQRLPQGEATLRNHVLVFSVGPYQDVISSSTISSK